MSDVVLAALIGTAGTLVVALIGIVGSRWLARVQRKSEENEQRLSAIETGQQHLIDNLTRQYDREHDRAEKAEREAGEWRARAVRAERQIDDYFKGMP